MNARRLAVELQLSAKRGTASGEQVNAVVETLLEMADKLERLEAENTKLRELVEDMYACISHANEQDWFYFERDKFGCGMSCTVNGEACGLRTLADHMRELGIEVSQ